MNVNLSALMGVARRAADHEGLSRSDAEDVAAIAVMHYLESSDVVEHPSAWIFLVARRKAWAHRRRNQLRERVEQSQPIHSDTTSTYFASMETLLDLKAALLALDRTERHAVLARDIEGKPLKVIAESSGLSVETIKRRIKSGRQSLHRALSGRSMRRNLHLTETL